MNESDPSQAPPEWWEADPSLRRYQAMEAEVINRLRAAARDCGYARPNDARRQLGTETWLILDRCTRDWEDFCARSTEEEIAEVGSRVAWHLVRVLKGESLRLTETAMGPISLRVDGNLTPLGKILFAGEDKRAGDAIRGRDLALHLAAMLNNDAELTPIIEVARISVSRAKATRVTKELLDIWVQNKDLSRASKEQFKRTLVRRLQEKG